MNIQLSDCPEILQKALEEKKKMYTKWNENHEIIAVTFFETKPYVFGKIKVVQRVSKSCAVGLQ